MEPSKGRTRRDNLSADDSGIETLHIDSTAVEAPSTEHQAMIETLKCIWEEMKVVRDKRSEALDQDKMAEKWRSVAAMYDRILFVAFLIIIFGITIWFTTLQPDADSQRLS